MLTNFFTRMNRIVGDQNTVARYLIEKVGHVALIAWMLVFLFGAGPLWAALVAAAVYDIVGKMIWWQTHRTFDGLDMIFDLIVVLLPGILTNGLTLTTLILFCVWLGALALFDNNQWGSPS